MGVAFFDLDKTLLAVNSATLWIRREVALGHITAHAGDPRQPVGRPLPPGLRVHAGRGDRGHCPAGGHLGPGHPGAHHRFL